MVIVKRFFTYRYKLAFIAGSTAALSEPGDGRRPEYVLLSFHYAVYIRFQAIVIVDRNSFLKVRDRIYAVETILLTKLGELGRAHKVVEHLQLGIVGVVHEIVYRALAQFHVTLYGRTDDAHG
jgi:hypothetical protein